ncbi:MAG: FKBP-type peptidyl-prolyl cis-trans isomerase [Alphaproteobacteria bacterium]|nr:FKBP-type peptidyl-prolyl cis-trans isomerase [Alphaproteobacteria bacterium]
MNINNFLKMPLVKIIVTILFIFYLYEQTKNDPRTASYQLSKINFGDSVDGLKNAINIAKKSSSGANYNSDDQDFNNDSNSPSQDLGPISFDDLLIGDKAPEALCGSQVSIQYSLLEKDSNNLINQSQITFKIGEGFNKLIEKAIIGMKGGGIRVIDIPNNFSTGDVNYDELIKTKKMIYKVLLIVANNTNISGASCE